MEISVLLPFHLENDFLWDAIDSVCSSVEVDFQLILIDDCKFPSRIEDFLANRSYAKVKLVRNKGIHGYGPALLAGKNYCDGNYVALMNSDDLMDPERLVKQLCALRDTNSDVCITKMRQISSSGKTILPILSDFQTKEFSLLYLLLGSYGANATWLMTRDWFEENFVFDSFDLLDWRIALSAFPDSKLTYIDEQLYTYRKHDLQGTKNRNLDDLIIPLQEAFELWKKLAGDMNTNLFEIYEFNFLALAFLDLGSITYDQVKTIAYKIDSLKGKIDDEIFNEIQRLFHVRVVVNIRNGKDLIDKLRMSTFCSKQFIYVALRFIYNFIRKLS